MISKKSSDRLEIIAGASREDVTKMLSRVALRNMTKSSDNDLPRTLSGDLGQLWNTYVQPTWNEYAQPTIDKIQKPIVDAAVSGGIDKAMGGLGKVWSDNQALRYGVYGAGLGGALGLGAGLFGRKKKTRAIGDALTGALLGGSIGFVGGGLTDTRKQESVADSSDYLRGPGGVKTQTPPNILNPGAAGEGKDQPPSPATSPSSSVFSSSKFLNRQSAKQMLYGYDDTYNDNGKPKKITVPGLRDLFVTMSQADKNPEGLKWLQSRDETRNLGSQLYGIVDRLDKLKGDFDNIPADKLNEHLGEVKSLLKKLPVGALQELHDQVASAQTLGDPNDQNSLIAKLQAASKLRADSKTPINYHSALNESRLPNEYWPLIKSHGLNTYGTGAGPDGRPQVSTYASDLRDAIKSISDLKDIEDPTFIESLQSPGLERLARGAGYGMALAAPTHAAVYSPDRVARRIIAAMDSTALSKPEALPIREMVGQIVGKDAAQVTWQDAQKALSSEYSGKIKEVVGDFTKSKSIPIRSTNPAETALVKTRAADIEKGFDPKLLGTPDALRGKSPALDKGLDELVAARNTHAEAVANLQKAEESLGSLSNAAKTAPLRQKITEAEAGLRLAQERVNAAVQGADYVPDGGPTAQTLTSGGLRYRSAEIDDLNKELNEAKQQLEKAKNTLDISAGTNNVVAAKKNVDVHATRVKQIEERLTKTLGNSDHVIDGLIKDLIGVDPLQPNRLSPLAQLQPESKRLLLERLTAAKAAGFGPKDLARILEQELAVTKSMMPFGSRVRNVPGARLIAPASPPNTVQGAAERVLGDAKKFRPNAVGRALPWAAFAAPIGLEAITNYRSRPGYVPDPYVRYLPADGFGLEVPQSTRQLAAPFDHTLRTLDHMRRVAE